MSWPNFFTILGATCMGVFLAFEMNKRYIKHIEEKQAIKLLELLKYEIAHNKDLLVEFKAAVIKDEYFTPFYDLRFSVWNTIPAKLAMLVKDSKFLNEIAKLYFEFQFLERKINKQFELWSQIPAASDKNTKKLLKARNDIVNSIKIHIEQVLKGTNRYLSPNQMMNEISKEIKNLGKKKGVNKWILAKLILVPLGVSFFIFLFGPLIPDLINQTDVNMFWWAYSTMAQTFAAVLGLLSVFAVFLFNGISTTIYRKEDMIIRIADRKDWTYHYKDVLNKEYRYGVLGLFGNKKEKDAIDERFKEIEQLRKLKKRTLLSLLLPLILLLIVILTSTQNVVFNGESFYALLLIILLGSWAILETAWFISWSLKTNYLVV